VFSHVCKAPITHLQWGRSSVGTLTVGMGDSVSMLIETVLYQGMCGEMQVMQISATNIQVNFGVGAGANLLREDPLYCDTKMLVRGLAVGRSCFVTWSGQKACVYVVEETAKRISALEAFESGSQAMAIGDHNSLTDDALFAIQGSAVRVTSFSGIAKVDAINFTEAEGIPLKIDLNERYLAVITDVGLIKVLDVENPKKPKHLGSTGRFQEAAGGDPLAVRAMRVNCSGSRVALLADHLEGALRVILPTYSLV